MKLIELAVRRPIAVLSIVLMIVLMGWLALRIIPIQLTPDVRKPLILIQTSWPGASPAEIEREIVIPQEEKLKGLEGLEKMESRARRGRATIILEFNITADRNRSILLINNRLQQVTGLPEEADEPILRTRDTDDNPIAWFSITKLPGNAKSIRSYGDFLDDVVRDKLERVTGVAAVNVRGGNESEIRVIVDPNRLAHYRITVPDVNSALRGTNISISAGEVDEGKREYRVRTESELNSVARVKGVVLRTQRDKASGRVFRVTVGDVANVEFGHKKRDARIRNFGQPAISVSAIRDTGANVIETMEGIKKVVDRLNKDVLPKVGLVMKQVHDDTIYIKSAIQLVTQNIWIGGTLAALILLLFLRSFGATAVVSLAIPVSVIGSFVALAALGRSINVISLAGIAFAVGMVVDAAIVVLENIYRHREKGSSKLEGAVRGAGEVWGAIMASAVTTIVVFAPILVMDLVVGQLFRDIAVALSIAVLLSLIVSITVVPTLANKLLGENTHKISETRRIPLVDDFASAFVNIIVGFTRIVITNRFAGILVVFAVTGLAAAGTYLFLPKLSYLPEGNRNFVLAIANPPPGYNLKTLNTMATKVESSVRRHWAKEGEEPKICDSWYSRIEFGSAGGWFPLHLKKCDLGPVKMERFWFVARSTSTFMAASALDPTRARELVPIMRRAIFSEPGTFGFARQTSLFGRGLGGSRIIELDITGPNLEDLLQVARQGVGILGRVMPRSEGYQIRPKPGLELGAPEVRVVPNLLRLADVGLTARDLAITVDAANDGIRAAEVTRGSKRIDLTLKGSSQAISTQGIGNLPVVTRTGQILPVSALATIDVTEGPTQIRHLERVRTVTLQIRPKNNVALEDAIAKVRKEVMAPLEKQGLPTGVRLTMSGTADELNRTWDAMVINLLIAIAIVYLVMAILYESFIFPLIILFSVPLATAGGVAGLSILNIYTFQALDMLTLLGFVILIGTVVNNAILLVHQTLHHVRKEAMDVAEAIAEATRNRIRPIFMSTMTTVFGMLPLVVIPGAGSELYRGLGSVVLGGLAMSAILTLLIIPPLLSFAAPLLRRQRGSMMDEVPVASAAE
jgi:hydrophobic/amphiphilic exporter-1 (mainly G- bacteria), HAE1 family